MDVTLLLTSFVFGTIGFGLFLYGKNSTHLIPLGAGLALMILPYFLPNLLLTLLICIPLTLAPFLIHE